MERRKSTGWRKEGEAEEGNTENIPIEPKHVRT